MSQARPLLTVEDLRTSFFTDDGEVPAVDGVSFHVNEGESVLLASKTRIVKPNVV